MLRLRIAFGMTSMVLGRIEEALAEMREAVRINPSHAAAYAIMGHLLCNAGLPGEGLEAAKRALRLSPYDPRLGLWIPALTQAYYFLGQYEDAITTAQRALLLIPTNAVPARFLAASLGQLGRNTEAEGPLARRSRANLRPRSRSASVIDRLLKNQNPLEIVIIFDHPRRTLVLDRRPGNRAANLRSEISSTREPWLYRSPVFGSGVRRLDGEAVGGRRLARTPPRRVTRWLATSTIAPPAPALSSAGMNSRPLSRDFRLQNILDCKIAARLLRTRRGRRKNSSIARELGCHNRRLAKDFENLAETLATFVTLAAILPALRRLARAEPAPRNPP
jgi:hypothetical protein